MRSSTMILAAGFGTRLLPLTAELPKPLVPIGDRTLLEHVLDRVDVAFLPAVVNVHHLSEIFREITAGWARIARVVVEPEIRGTAGGVAGAREHLVPGPVLVVNADVLANYDARRALAAAPEQGLCLVLAPPSGARGNVGLARDGRVARLRGELFAEEASSGDYVGTLAIGEGALSELPETGCLIGDVALPLLRRKKPVVGRVLAAPDWRAPGDSLSSYLRENLRWLAARAGETGSFVGTGATLGPGVELEASLVGAGARVLGAGKLTRVVVSPGATARAPLEQAVVTSAGTVVPVSG